MLVLVILPTASGCDETLYFDGGDAGLAADSAAANCAMGCDGGLVCEPSLQQCVMPCGEGPTEHDCPASAPTCNERARYCVSCTTDEECVTIADDGNVCNRSTGQCAECLDDTECSYPRPRCDPGSLKCVECLTTSDCLDQDSCNPVEKTCD